MKVRMSGSDVAIFAVILAVVLGLIIGIPSCQAEKGAESEVLYTPGAEEFTYVYADITWVSPQFSITTRGNGVTSEDIVCKCLTTNGETLWLCMDDYDYQECFEPDNWVYELDFADKSLATPVQVHGLMREADDMCKGLAQQIGCDMVLLVVSVGKQE